MDKKPKNDTVENILRSIEVVQKCVDLFYEVRILGGEPFLHKQLHQINLIILIVKDLALLKWILCSL